MAFEAITAKSTVEYRCSMDFPPRYNARWASLVSGREKCQPSIATPSLQWIFENSHWLAFKCSTIVLAISTARGHSLVSDKEKAGRIWRGQFDVRLKDARPPRVWRTLALTAAEIRRSVETGFFPLLCCFWVTPKQSENAYNLGKLNNRN
jgi:hypothetical protein